MRTQTSVNEALPQIGHNSEALQGGEVTFSDVLADAQASLMMMTADDKFHELCIDRRINPNEDMDTPQYWNTFADYVSKGLDESERDGVARTPAMIALRLVASTPAYIHSQHFLNQNAVSSERGPHRERASAYNNLVRDFAISYGYAARAKELQRSLASVANITIEDSRLKQSVSDMLRQTIRGAQHELAFAQIAALTGEKVTPANLEEDLKGIDLYIGNVPVDVKASLTEIDRRNGESTRAYAVHGHKVAMFSFVTDQELNGRFFIPEALAEIKAPAVSGILSQARRELRAA